MMLMVFCQINFQISIISPISLVSRIFELTGQKLDFAICIKTSFNYHNLLTNFVANITKNEFYTMFENLAKDLGLSKQAIDIIKFAEAYPSAAINEFKDPVKTLKKIQVIQEVPEWVINLFGFENLEELLSLEQQNPHLLDQLVARMPARITPWYAQLASNSEALRNLVVVDPDEISDISGTVDPSNQISYMPQGAEKGITHKYFDTVHLMIILACAAYCRYCYQAGFLSQKNEKRPTKPKEAIEYIRGFLQKFWKFYDEKLGYAVDPETLEVIFPITNVLLTGGDALQTTNLVLAIYITSLAESGINNIRFGSKVPIFQPTRGDDNFFALLDKIHNAYPDLTLNIVTHITHPDEILQKDSNGDYIRITQSNMPTIYYKWHEPTEAFFAKWIAHQNRRLYNQFPIIRNINDNPRALSLIFRETARRGIQTHNVYACRQIEGHQHFEIPLVTAFENISKANYPLDGLSAKGRLILSTKYGKIHLQEVVKPCLGFPDGLMIFRRIRTPQQEFEVDSGIKGGGRIITTFDEKAHWLDDLMDKRILDEVTGVQILYRLPHVVTF
jgi:lysine 2,3-aminomutase